MFSSFEVTLMSLFSDLQNQDNGGGGVRFSEPECILLSDFEVSLMSLFSGLLLNKVFRFPGYVFRFPGLLLNKVLRFLGFKVPLIARECIMFSGYQVSRT
jgi:hypothetical protein